MIVGKLRHFVAIQRKTIKKNEFGEEIVTFNDLCHAWSKIEPLNGREYFLAQQTQAETTHKILIRFIDGIRPDYRVLYGNRIFDVKSVTNSNEQNIELIMYCREFLTP